MGTLINDEKMGFYPMPPEAEQRMLWLLKKPELTERYECSVFDPFCGEGVALKALSDHLGGVSYGVELSTDRARSARNRVNHMIDGNFYNTTIGDGIFSVALVNPKYDYVFRENEDPATREEYVGLRAVMRHMMPGGVILFVIPRNILRYPQIARYIVGRLDKVKVYDFPESERAIYKQVIVVGVVRPKIERSVASMAATLVAIGQVDQVGSTILPSIEELPTEDEGGVYAVPVRAKASAKFFTNTPTAYEVLATTFSEETAIEGKTWERMNTMRSIRNFKPVTPIRRGHVAMLLASNAMGATRLLPGVVAKGYATKKWVKVPSLNPGQTIRDETFSVEVNVLTSPDGYGLNLQTIQKPEELETFMAEHAEGIADTINKRYPCRYNTPDPQKWLELDRLVPKKKLPGRNTTGPLNAQKHVILAADMLLTETSMPAQIVADMGFGKTLLALGTIWLRNAFPAIVMCPPHLVEKWVRECKDVIPGGKVKPVLVETIKEMRHAIESYKKGDQLIVILSKERAKLGPGWMPAYKTTQIKKRNIRGQYNRDADGKWVMETVPVCPTCGSYVVDAKGVSVDLETIASGRNRLFCHAMKHDGDRCGAALFQYKGVRQKDADSETGTDRWPIARYVLKKHRGFFKMFVADEVHQYKGQSTDQARSFDHLIVAAEKTITLTGSFIGGKSTDIFWLLYRLLPSLRDEFNFADQAAWIEMYGRNREITSAGGGSSADGRGAGTKRITVRTKEIPGVSPSVIEWLLPGIIFARVSDLGYTLPPYKEEIKYIRMAGDPEADLTGVGSEVIPGSEKKNLGIPSLRLIIDGPTQTDQYRKLESFFAPKIKGWTKGRMSWISVWLQTMLGRVNAGFRDELIMHKIPGSDEKNPEDNYENAARITGLMDPEDEEAEVYLLPKETWLIDAIRGERKFGRKTIIFCRQTGTRDIQPRLKEILGMAGFRAVILPDNIPARKREAWIDEHVDDFDALICNPMKVETGLDLVKFSTAIFYEPHFSLYTLWQAMKRIYRPGQVRSTKIIFAVYEGTLEHEAMKLMSAKLRTAQMVYGEDAYSAIAEEDAGDDFLASLAHRVLEEGNVQAGGLQALLVNDQGAEEWIDITVDVDAPSTVFGSVETDKLYQEILSERNAISKNADEGVFDEGDLDDTEEGVFEKEFTQSMDLVPTNIPIPKLYETEKKGNESRIVHISLMLANGWNFYLLEYDRKKKVGFGFGTEDNKYSFISVGELEEYNEVAMKRKRPLNERDIHWQPCTMAELEQRLERQSERHEALTEAVKQHQGWITISMDADDHVADVPVIEAAKEAVILTWADMVAAGNKKKYAAVADESFF